jgi:hypothetical protein
MGAHQRFAGELVDGAGNALGEAAAVDEDEGGGVGADELEELGMDGAPDGGADGGLRGGAAGEGDEVVEARHIVERDFDAQVDALGRAGVDDGDVAVARGGVGGFEFGEDFGGGGGGAVLFGGGRGGGAAEEAGDLVERALGGGESDALYGVGGERFQAFQGEGEVAAALGGDQGVDFVQHHGLHRPQRLARVGGEEEVDGFRRGDQDIGGMAGEAGAVGGGGVAGAYGDGGLVERDAGGAGGLGDADQRGAQVAFDIDGEGLDGGNVEDAAALAARRDGREHKVIDAPQEGGDGFAGAGGGEDEGGFAARDGGPAELLRPRGGGEDGVEPGAHGRVEEVEGVSGHGDQRSRPEPFSIIFVGTRLRVCDVEVGELAETGVGGTKPIWGEVVWGEGGRVGGWSAGGSGSTGGAGAASSSWRVWRAR